MKVDTDQWIAKPDNQSILVVSDQSVTCSRDQLNPSNQLSLRNLDNNINPDNRETVYAKQFDCSRKYGSDELENFPNTQRNEKKNDSQLSVVPPVKFRKSLKATISIQVITTVYACNELQILKAL